LFAEEAVSVKVVADASQSVVYARLDSVYGNEITYTVVNPVSEEDIAGSNEGNSGLPNRAGRENAEGMPDFGSMPQDVAGTQEPGNMSWEAGAEGTGSMPQGVGQQGSGNATWEAGAEGADSMPQDAAGTQEPGNMPWEVGAEGTESMPSRGVSGGTTGVQAALVYDNVSYALSTETGEVMIPVGTEVTTRLGTVSTFSRLRAGDYVALVMDQDGNEQVIASVYVIG
jgi:hypothetical protein